MLAKEFKEKYNNLKTGDSAEKLQKLIDKLDSDQVKNLRFGLQRVKDYLSLDLRARLVLRYLQIKEIK